MRVFKSEEVFDGDCGIGIRKQTDAGGFGVHMHEFVEIVYISKGRGVHCIDDTAYPVKRGDLLFINYRQTHSFDACSQMEYYNIFMKPEFISTELINQENAFEMLTLTMFEEFRASFDAGSPMVRFAGAEIRLIESIIAGILDEHTNKKIGYKVMLKSYMTALITHTFRKMSLVQEENERVRLEEVLRYIEENCEQKLTLGMLAEQCFYNPSYFSRMFKEYSGVTLTDFIHASRIKKACELLEKTTLTVESIGFGVGYSDKTMFYRQFKKRMGMLPSAFRK